MNKTILTAMMMLGLAGAASAAVQNFSFNARTKVIRDGSAYFEIRPYTYAFTVEVTSDDEGIKAESRKNGRPFIAARPEERYSITLHNPLPIRAGVNLTIDGLNSITGEPTSPSKGKKWIIDPYSSVTIRGWQVNNADARRFYFTSKDSSYATWRSNSWGRDLSVNCGVIGAAFFWSDDEMEDWLARNPVYEYTQNYRGDDTKEKDQISGMMHKSLSANEAQAAPPAAQRQKAGTGMGEHESHQVRHVNFDFDTGMYRVDQAVIIYYDFISRPIPPRPQPFEDRYAPEMP
jgi:hypothetical protein